VFKGIPQKETKSIHIGEYRGEHIVTKTPNEFKALLDASKKGKAIQIKRRMQ
jgi:hypothetical protein